MLPTVRRYELENLEDENSRLRAQLLQLEADRAATSAELIEVIALLRWLIGDVPRIDPPGGLR